MQFQIPQFIETEDKIIGPFTIKQFLYVAGAAAFSFILYFTIELWVWALFSIFALAIAGGFAFIKIHGRPLSRIAISAFNFYWKPQTYVWKKEKLPMKKEGVIKKEKGIPIEDIVSGASLHAIWGKLQTGNKISNRQFFKKATERYQVFRRITGERRAAKRVDYR